MPLKEAHITKQIRDVLRLKRIFHWKQWQGPMSEPRGVSDILGCFEGKLLAIEVKVPGKHPTPAQITFQDAVIRAGGISDAPHVIGNLLRRGGTHGPSSTLALFTTTVGAFGAAFRKP